MKRKKWTTDDIPGQAGRVAVVTGANTGIGRETARALAGKGARVVLAVRNPGKGQAAAHKIREDHPQADLTVMNLDLADLGSVKDFADAFAKEYDRLGLLVNNAGVMAPPLGRTRQGFEQQMGINHLGHFALTGRLLDRLTATPGSRVVAVSSGAHRIGKPDFGDLNWQQRRYRAWRAYGDSKLANLYFAFELQRRLEKAGTDALAVAAHPGWTDTELQRHRHIMHFFTAWLAQGSRMGALPTLRAAVDPQVKGGEYYGPGGFLELRGYPVKVNSSDSSKDPEAARRLWEASEEMTGVKFGL